MKLVDDKNHVQRSDTDQTEQEFQIDSTPEAFKILFNGLYSDKIMATCREIICNAMDESPGRIPDITLPGGGGPLVFTVRDYGTGLDHDDVMTLYTTVFRSTKKHANDKIGGFGLGSKAPFAYTDGFSVTSCYDEGGITMRRVYSMFMDENGRPRVTMMHEEKTDEPAGLEVSVPVQREDSKAFTEATQKVLRHFPEERTPDLGDRDVPRPKYVRHWGSFAIAEQSVGYYTARVHSSVVMGNIQYPLELSSEFLSTADNDGYSKQLLSYVYDLEVTLFLPIGSVGLAPSREALSYTKATIRALCAAMENVATTFKTEMQAVVDAAANNRWDRAKALYAFLGTNECHEQLFNSYGFKGVFNTHNKMYRGINLPTPVEFLYPTINRANKLVIKKEALRRLGVRNVADASLAFVRMDGLTKEFRVRTWARQQYEAGNETRVVLFETLAQAKTVMDLIDKPVSLLQLASQLPVKVKPRAKRTSTNTDVGLRKYLDVYQARCAYRSSATYFWNNLADNEEEFTFGGGGYYVPTNRGQIIRTMVSDDGTHVDLSVHPRQVSAILKVLRIEDTRVLGVRKLKQKKFDKANQWVNLLDHVTVLAETAITPEFLDLRSKVTATDPCTEALYKSMLSKGYREIAATNVTLKKVWDQESCAKVRTRKVQRVTNLAEVAGIDLPEPATPNKIHTITWVQMQKDFPMLKHIQGAWAIGRCSEEIIEYILKVS